MTAKLTLPRPPVLVAGIGRAGEAALELLRRTWGAAGVFAWDAKQQGDIRSRAKRWRARGVQVALGGDGIDLLLASGATTIVKSPGIDMEVPLLRTAAARGVQVIDELELGWRASVAPLVAVTGTNGKSTTCALIASILAAAGRKTQVAGNTEFGPPLSAAAQDAHIVCEVSSFQLQAAPTFLPEVAVFTNLSLEHLPRHGNMEAYGDTKRLLFVRNGRAGGMAIINIDDDCGRSIARAVGSGGGRSVCYGFSPDADVRILAARWTMREAETTIRLDGDVTPVRSRLPGRHNALNIAAALACGRALGLDNEIVVAGLESARAPPGRWELVDAGQSFDVVIDYAHTPDGVAQVLQSARAVTAARGTALRTVFGPVGVHDPAKMEGCARSAATLSNHLILTTGSAPRSARILRIRELRDAARSAERIEVVLERREAIARAIAAARSGDVVAILGLGALRRIVLDGAGTTSASDDGEAARAALAASKQCAL